MDKELIDRVWKYCLPKEFKEEVKDCYKTAKAQHKENFHLEVEAALIRERIIMLEYFFGIHNIASDAGGEDEMLCVSRKQVQEIYKTSKNIVRNEEYGTKMYSMHIQILCVLESLFGTKCLPDETKDETKEPKPAAPKYKEGDWVKMPNGDIAAITAVGMEDAIMNLDKISQDVALPFTPSTPRYTQALEKIAERMMEAHENEDWQDIAHLALDVIPRIIEKLK